jgi:hypothetical protein
MTKYVTADVRKAIIIARLTRVLRMKLSIGRLTEANVRTIVKKIQASDAKVADAKLKKRVADNARNCRSVGTTTSPAEKQKTYAVDIRHEFPEPTAEVEVIVKVPKGASAIVTVDHRNK